MSTHQQINSQNQWICPTDDTNAPGAIQAPDPGIDKRTHVATAQFDGDTFTGWKIQTKEEYQAEQEAVRQQREAELEPQRQRAEIQRQLDELDRQAIRPLRAVQAGTDTQADRDRMSELESEAQALRDQLDAIAVTE